MIVAPEDIVRFVPAEEIAKYIPEDVIREYVLPNAEIHVGFSSGLSQPDGNGLCNKPMRTGLCAVKAGHVGAHMSAESRARKAEYSRAFAQRKREEQLASAETESAALTSTRWEESA